MSGRDSARAVELQQLQQVAVGILERRDPDIRVLRRVLDELHTGALQSLVVGGDVIGREADHVPCGVSVAAVYPAVRAERERRRVTLPEHDEAWRLAPHREPEHVPIEGKQAVEVLAPDRRPAEVTMITGLRGATIWSE